MREPVGAQRVRALLEALGRVSPPGTRLYLTGGATAVLEGWRERSPFVLRSGNLDVHHFDPHSQALSKVERGFDLDVEDVKAMLERGMIDAGQARELYDAIEPELFRYPAIDPASFRARINEAFD